MKPSRIRLLSALSLSAMLCAGNASATVMFSDDFNRPDSSSVGNGWLDSLNNQGDPFSIVGGVVTASNSAGRSGIYRDFEVTNYVTISATLHHGSGYITTPAGGRFQHRITAFGDDNYDTGYGIHIERSDSWVNNSSIQVWDGNTLVDSISPGFQFWDTVALSFTIFTDGVIQGAVTQGSNVFNFSFGAYAFNNVGNQVTLSADNSTRTPLGRFDNVYLETDDAVIEQPTVPVPAPVALMAAGLTGIAIRRKQRAQPANG